MASNSDLSQCLPIANHNMGQISEVPRSRTPKHVLRAQALLTLLACGPLNRSQLATIIAAHAGKKSESIRRAFESERDVLRALEEAWLIERIERNKLRITPVGIRALRNTVSISFFLPQAAARLEEWEPSLRGLACVVKYADREILPKEDKQWFEPIGKVLNYVLRDVHERLQERYPEFAGDTGFEILESLTKSFFSYSIQTLIELLRERERTRLIQDFRDFIEFYINNLTNTITESTNKAYGAIVKCRLGECSSEDEILIEMLYEGGDDWGLLIELSTLKSDFVERITGWPGGRPPLTARLALREAGSLLRKIEPSYIISGLDYCRQEVGELLISLVAVHVVNRLVLSLEELYSDLDAVSRHYGTLALAYMNIESSDLRQALSFLVLLRDVIARFREYWMDAMLRLKGSHIRKLRRSDRVPQKDKDMGAENDTRRSRAPRC